MESTSHLGWHLSDTKKGPHWHWGPFLCSWKPYSNDVLTFVVFTFAFLAVARLTRLLVEDKITLRYRQWVIRRWGEESMAAYLVHCPWCTSVYIAAVVMPATVWITFHTLHPSPWYFTVLVAALSIPAASHIAGMLNRE